MLWKRRPCCEGNFFGRAGEMGWQISSEYGRTVSCGFDEKAPALLQFFRGRFPGREKLKRPRRMRCPFSHPELLKGTRLVQVGSWIALSIVETRFGFK